MRELEWEPGEVSCAVKKSVLAQIEEKRTVRPGLVSPPFGIVVINRPGTFRWSLTHLSTGLRVAYFSSQIQAQQAATELSGFDWDFSDSDSPKVKSMKEPVRVVVASCGGVMK